MILKPRTIKNIDGIDKVDSYLAYFYQRRDVQNAQQLDLSLSSLARPDLLSGLDAALPLIYQAALENQKIVIVGDFDVDGATSTALLMRGFKALGLLNIDYLIPDRFDEGYGLTHSVVDRAIACHADLIITVDNGISANSAIDYANEQGLKVIVTDHHLAPQQLPNAAAIVNPQQADCAFPSKNLSGVGVAFYLLLGLRTYLRSQHWFEMQNRPEFNLARLLDLVAVGTISDIVPLDHNNRILVQYGLNLIRQQKTIAGINALLKVLGKQNADLSAQDIGFYIGPRLNAAGRMDNMAIGVELLLTDDPKRADEIAQWLNDLNTERKNVQKEMQFKAIDLLKQMSFDEANLPNSLVVFHDEFHEGVIGLLSSRLKDQYYRPVFSFAKTNEGLLKGSGRSIEGIHLRDVLELISHQDPHLIQCFGGHAMAAGLTIKADHLEKFKQLLAQTIEKKLTAETLTQVIETDGEPPAPFLTYDVAQYLKLKLPWGAGFPEPLFQGEFEVIQQRLIGAEKSHLKFLLKNAQHQCFDAILFHCEAQKWPDYAIKKIVITYRLEPNEYQGKKSVTLLIQNIVQTEY